MTVKPLKNIQKSEEIFHSYNAHYRYKIYCERQKLLKELFFFHYQCTACVQKLQPVCKAFICIVCKGSVVCDQKTLCLFCGSQNLLQVEKVLKDCLECLKWVKFN